MKENQLPAPGTTREAYHMRRITTRVLTHIQLASRNRPGGYHPEAVKLKAFFDAASAYCAEFIEPEEGA